MFLVLVHPRQGYVGGSAWGSVERGGAPSACGMYHTCGDLHALVRKANPPACILVRTGAAVLQVDAIME